MTVMAGTELPMPNTLDVCRDRLIACAHAERQAWLDDDPESEAAAAELIDQLLTQWQLLRGTMGS